ncbi:MAG: hypothetical protein HKO66_09450 [Saprospiraceae bacterium]|nr:hypothetical protein [Bacteroidia bacterium]NNL92443.1 hypothetical protein [Saprospiraceae bacterium]
MKKALFSLAIVTIISCLISCGKDTDSCTDITFDTTFSFQEGDIFCLNGEYEITVKSVNDERCPCDVICVWEGEFTFDIEVEKEGEIKSYLLHEAVINEEDWPFDLGIHYIGRLFEDDCDNPVPVDDYRFEMMISVN